MVKWLFYRSTILKTEVGIKRLHWSRFSYQYHALWTGSVSVKNRDVFGSTVAFGQIYVSLIKRAMVCLPESWM